MFNRRFNKTGMAQVERLEASQHNATIHLLASTEIGININIRKVHPEILEAGDHAFAAFNHF